jgi:hypothetical protein
MSDLYSDLLYGTSLGTRQNNCYAWAIDYYKNSGDSKLQPGDLAGMRGGVNLSSCSDLVSRALADAKSMKWDLRVLKDSDQCPRGSYKIMAVLAPNEDFHWYRHHRDMLYKIKTPRSRTDVAKEFDVPVCAVQAASEQLNVGDLVFIKDANVWSHKQGFSPDGPLLRDSCGRLIKNPATACRKYGGRLNYSRVCATFCFKKRT